MGNNQPVNATLSGQTLGYQCASIGPDTFSCRQMPPASGAPTYTGNKINSEQASFTSLASGGPTYGCDLSQVIICSPNQTPQFGLIGTWGPDGIILSWTGTGISAGATFEVFRGTSDRPLAKIRSNGGNAYSYTDKTALENQNYTYRVTATNSIGENSSQSTTITSPNGSGGSGPRSLVPATDKPDQTWWLLGAGGLLFVILFVVLVIFLARRKDED